MNGWSTALLIVGILFLVFIVILFVMRRRRNRAIRGAAAAARGGGGRYAKNTGTGTGTDTIPDASPLKFPEKNTYEKFYDVLGVKLYDAEPKVRDELESTFYDEGSLEPYHPRSKTSITSITPEEEGYSGGGYAGDKYLSGLKDQYN